MVTFREVQQFRQKWLWIIIGALSLCLVVVFGYGMIRQLILGDPWGSKPMSDPALAAVGSLMFLMGIGLPLVFYRLRLLTEVRGDGVYVDFVPLARQKVPFEDIISCDAQTYKPIRDYLGWGVRYGRNGKAYTVSGNRGVQLQLSKGGGLLIGSQCSEELAQAINAALNNKSTGLTSQTPSSFKGPSSGRGPR